MAAGAVTWVSNARGADQGNRAACERYLRGSISLSWWLIGYRGRGGENRFLAQASRWKVGRPGPGSLASRSGTRVPHV